jgi:hypothetical protein
MQVSNPAITIFLIESSLKYNNHFQPLGDIGDDTAVKSEEQSYLGGCLKVL